MDGIDIPKLTPRTKKSHENFFNRLLSLFKPRSRNEPAENGLKINGNGHATKNGIIAYDIHSPTKLNKTIFDEGAKDENPLYILTAAAQGNLGEVKRLLLDDEERLKIQDYRGQNVFHHSVAYNRTAILDHLYTYKNSPHYQVNARDKLGDTPLHVAIEKNHIQSISWLLEHRVDLNILNNNSAAPIHVAIEINRLDIVKMIVAQNHEMVHLRGDFGYIPLQYACANDLPEIARYLLSEGAELFVNNDIGYSAIHAAIRNGSANVVDALIEFGAIKGISGEKLIHTLDKEQNFPLHIAVNSGDIKAVKVCLKVGADINAQHPADKQSAIHYAASKGSVEILKAMFEAQPTKVENCLHCRDILVQTPLHKAAGYNHVAAVEFLMESGASINAQDSERRTPLLLASSKGAIKVINFLLRRNVNTSLRDKDNRNFLHMAIMTGLKLSDLEIYSLKNLKALLNERDDFGCCPIHYASKAGQLLSVKGLLNFGANATIKDNEKQSPLHYAAKHGKLQTAKKLLNSQHGALLLNEVDGDGRTALLIAAMYGHYKVIALLARKGAQMSKDFVQNTALHLGSEYGNHETVILLTGLAPHLLNMINKDGNTALHLAAQNGHALIVDYLMTANAKFLYNADGASFFDLALTKFQSDAAAAVIRHSRCEEVMQLRGIIGSPLIGLIQHLPKICNLFLDKCITYAATNKKSREFYVQYDFRYLKTPDYMIEDQKKSDSNKHKLVPLLPLNMMVRHNRVDCLAHPLCVNFLTQKWTSYGALLYIFRIGLYVLFLMLLTSVAYDVDNAVGQVNCELMKCNNETSTTGETYNINRTLIDGENSTMPDMNVTESVFENVKMVNDTLSEGGLLVRMVLVALFCLVNFAIQFFTIIEQKLAYFFDFNHYIELALYTTTFCMTIPSIFGLVNLTLQFIASVICMFLGWINFLLYLQRFDFFGIYIVMFVEILKGIIRVFVVFSFIIVAFALTLTFAFRATDGPADLFTNPLQSLIAVIAMMLGETDYPSLIIASVTGDRPLLYPQLAYIVYCGFLILMPILLTNLLVGLAVGNIESVQKNARLKRLAMQVEFFTALERRLPKAFLKRRLQEQWKYYPNQTQWTFIEKIRATMKRSGGGEVGGGDEGEQDRNNFAYLLEELTAQSRNVSGLGTKCDNEQERLKLVLQKMDAVLFNGGRLLEPDNESGDEEPANLAEKANSSQAASTEYSSPGSQAQWQTVATRFAAFKKPKASQFVVEEEDEEEQQSRVRNRRGRLNSTSSDGVDSAPLVFSSQ